MLKMLLCLFSAMLLAVALLQMRQQHLEISYRNNRLYGRIDHSKAQLWNQQMQIAVYTAPNAIARTVGDHALDMVPIAPLPGQKAHWISPAKLPDAD